ncbi:unnamed protein product [Dibothriocephalus latus]|uniref:Uncharacterized protein n=1 Tax=Dibothriocephalus latus TaxID=60516 RepID=A0A3P7MVS1_DIBLA|nr:unnamed protein product [Dibothriocephalus latus]
MRLLSNFYRPGERSQLWYISDTGHILHEGSSVPCEPSSRERQHLSKRSWVLDVDTGTPAADAIRNHRGFLVNDASFCVQAARDLEYRTLQSSCSSLQCLLGGSILVARPRRDARCLVSKTLSAAKIMTAWLRPGSGCLDVEVIADGPVKVLVISDHYEEPLPTTSLQSIRSRLSSSTLDTNRTINPTSLKVS